MTIAEKLASIKASKEAIKQAIEEKGVACGDVLSEYPEKIAAIPTGGDGIDMSSLIKFGSSQFTYEQLVGLNTYNWEKVQDLGGMFQNCARLTTIPDIDISNAMHVFFMFYKDTALITIPPLNTSNCTDFRYMFNSCTSLTTVPLLDLDKAKIVDLMFFKCHSLTNLGGFKNLSLSLALNDSPLLTVESLMNVIDNLKDLTGGTAQTLTLGATNLAKLTDEQKAVATNKNWVLA